MICARSRLSRRRPRGVDLPRASTGAWPPPPRSKARGTRTASGVSIWDTFAHTPEKIKNDENGDIANDHYHRYADDVALMKSMSVTAYRFSIAWPRIFPDGTGTPNVKGIDFYKRLTDELRANGIEPFATLYHWDLPQALQDKYGAWRSRDTAAAFADYCGYTAAELGDRVGHYFTINEFSSFVEQGYRGAEAMIGGKAVRFEAAPGLDVGPDEIHQVRHHTVLGHGMAVQAIRAQGPAGAKIGPAEVIQCAGPLIESPEHIEAALAATRELNAAYLTVMLEGRYTDGYLSTAGAGAPTFSDEDLRVIASPLNFVGTQRLQAGVVRAGIRGAARLARGPVRQGAPEDVQQLVGAGSGSDLLGEPSDWSMMDNFEWMGGYGNRCGMVLVDFDPLKRTPKLSADWFRAAARQNAIA